METPKTWNLFLFKHAVLNKILKQFKTLQDIRKIKEDDKLELKYFTTLDYLEVLSEYEDTLFLKKVHEAEKIH